MDFPSVLICFAGLATAAITCTSAVPAKDQQPAQNNHEYRIMFYNAENLFDVVDDSLTNDEEFTPAGNLHWTSKRYAIKLRNTSKVIIATGGWQPPDVIGLCEVENRQVLQDLIRKTPLSKFDYRIVHEDSPDKRGIDVALIYNAKKVENLFSTSYRIKRKDLFTRNILYMKAKLGNDTCHFFVNHWPSRAAGQLESEKNRFAAARLLKHLTDSLFALDPNAGILIMGDFNDEPSDESISVKLNAKVSWTNPAPRSLYNLAATTHAGLAMGTLKYQGEWNTFDQVIVSGKLLSGGHTLNISSDGYRILQNTFLLESDKTYNGFKPFRTYRGFIFQGGYSDHLPVYVDLVWGAL
jgi:predicted extracellular nuclease